LQTRQEKITDKINILFAFQDREIKTVVNLNPENIILVIL
jgi:hypothetical protein